MSDGCRGLAAVIEQREAFGIVAASQKTDEAALLRCRLGYNDAGPSTEATPYKPAAEPPFDRAPPNRSTDEVTIERYGNTYTVPVRINGTITLPFILDTGAGELAIPADVALTLIRAGALTDSDFVGKGRYTMANGAEQLGDRVILREVQVGDHTVRNVTAFVSPPAGTPLLGQSFLSKFGQKRPSITNGSFWSWHTEPQLTFAQSRSRPYPFRGCRIWNRPAADANQGPSFRRRSAEPLRRDRVRLDGQSRTRR